MRKQRSKCPRHFNSRAHVERDLGYANNSREWRISTHALTWSATFLFAHFIRPFGNFNSRAHVERDDSGAFTFMNGGNFNSRAHVERDELDALVALKIPHFNSRAHVERDRYHARAHQPRADFNSRAHVERDVIGHCRYAAAKISTHALTWSATIYALGEFATLDISTHALTWSATGVIGFCAWKTKFQLTRSRGARREILANRHR